MRLKLSKKTRKKLPIGDDATPLKTKEKLEHHLQEAISFLQTQQNVLERTVEILEEVGKLSSTMKEDIIRSISKSDEKRSRLRFKELRQELKWLSSLEFNSKNLFSQNNSDSSFKLFKDASPTAPQIKQPAAPHYLQSLQDSDEEVDLGVIEKSLQALMEMLGESDAAVSDLMTSFKALASNPEAHEKLRFIEERVKTWVSEVIEGQNGLVVQANLLSNRVDGLVRGLRGLANE